MFQKYGLRPNIFIIAIILLSLLPLYTLFITTDLRHMHDSLVHLPRIAAYFQALSDGHFPVRWAGNLNYGYGLPLFNFIYQIPYLIASFFILIGFGLVSAFKASIILAYTLSGIGMFLFVRSITRDEKKAFLAAILYQFAPFHIVDTITRGSFGEMYTYAFLPFAVFGFVKLFKKFSYKHFLVGSVFSGLLVLSHNSVSLLFYGMLGLFVLIFARTKRNFLLGISVLVTGLLISAFYWLPAILEHKYTYGDLFMKDLYKEHFAPFYYYLVPNILNSRAFQIGNVSVQIGPFHLAGLVFAVLYLFKQKKEKYLKKTSIYIIILSFFAFIFMLPVSRSAWENISYLRQFQFPWRFLSIIVFTSSLTSVFFFSLDQLKKPIIYFGLVFLVIATSFAYWLPPEGYDKVNEEYYWNFPLDTTYYGETDVIWSAGEAYSYPKTRIDLIGGQGEIYNIEKKTTLHTFSVDAKNDIQIVDKTTYFPGWKVFVDGKKVPIEFQDAHWRGQLVFYVSRGKHEVRVVFGENKVRKIADLISVASLSGLLLGGILHKKFT